jgi:soluble lytic murein transglycosylase-like protein
VRARSRLVSGCAGRSTLILCSLAIAAFAATASRCWADVIDIGLDGVATTYASPAVFTPSGVQVIASDTRVRAVLAPAMVVSQVIAAAAVRHKISADLITAVAWQESRFHQTAVSTRDAVGVMQLTAGTARDLGVDRYDISQNIHGGAAYLRRMLDRYGGDTRLALAAYNAGPGAVDRYRGVPPYRETQAYVGAILAGLSQRALAAAPPAPFAR